MRFGKQIFLLAIILLVCFLFGTPTKEGIADIRLAAVIDIIHSNAYNTNDDRLNAIKNLNIKDSRYATIINDQNLNTTQILNQLKELIRTTVPNPDELQIQSFMPTPTITPLSTLNIQTTAPFPTMSLPTMSLPTMSLPTTTPFPTMSLPTTTLSTTPFPTMSLPTMSLPTSTLFQISTPLPTMSLPTMSLPTMSLPTMSLPTMSLPTMSLPTMSLPTMSLPTSTLTSQ